MSTYRVWCFVLLQLMTIISTIDDMNYPEKTNTYYIVNAPYIFSACWKVNLLFLSLQMNILAFKSLLLSIILDKIFSKRRCYLRNTLKGPWFGNHLNI